MAKQRYKISDYQYVIYANPVTVFVIDDKEAGKKFVGIAKCDPRDEYKKSVGLGIARLRAEIAQKQFYLNHLK